MLRPDREPLAAVPLGDPGAQRLVALRTAVGERAGRIVAQRAGGGLGDLGRGQRGAVRHAGVEVVAQRGQRSRGGEVAEIGRDEPLDSSFVPRSSLGSAHGGQPTARRGAATTGEASLRPLSLPRERVGVRGIPGAAAPSDPLSPGGREGLLGIRGLPPEAPRPGPGPVFRHRAALEGLACPRWPRRVMLSGVFRLPIRTGAWGQSPHIEENPRVGGWARAAQRARPGWGCGGHAPPTGDARSPSKACRPASVGPPHPHPLPQGARHPMVLTGQAASGSRSWRCAQAVASS